VGSADVERDSGAPAPGRPPTSRTSSSPHLQALLQEAARALDAGRSVEGADLSRSAVELAVATGDRANEAAGLAMLARQLTRLGDHELTAATWKLPSS